LLYQGLQYVFNHQTHRYLSLIKLIVIDQFNSVVCCLLAVVCWLLAVVCCLLVVCGFFNNQLPITNYQLPITNYQLPITNLENARSQTVGTIQHLRLQLGPTSFAGKSLLAFGFHFRLEPRVSKRHPLDFFKSCRAFSH